MLYSTDNLPIHFLLWLGMLLIMFVTRWSTQRNQEKRSARESEGMRTILLLELAELRVVYDENLRRIAEKKPSLLSGRPFLMVSKCNLGRLAIYEPAAIAPVISAIAFNEHIEGAISMRAKPVGNTIYRLERDAGSLEEVRVKLQLGSDKIEAALAALQPDSQARLRKQAGARPFAVAPTLLASAATVEP